MMRKTEKKTRPPHELVLPVGVKVVAAPKNAAMRKWMDEPDIGCILTAGADVKQPKARSRKVRTTGGKLPL
jgi:hypothetical protein